MNNQHHAFLLEANYYLSAYKVYFKLALATEQKILFLLTQFCHCTLKSRKTYHSQFGNILFVAGTCGSRGTGRCAVHN